MTEINTVKPISKKLHLLKGHKKMHTLVSYTQVSIVLIQVDRSDMAWTSKILVIVITATVMAEKLSLPPVAFLKDFAMKYQRRSVIMNLPKVVPRSQVLKR